MWCSRCVRPQQQLAALFLLLGFVVNPVVAQPPPSLPGETVAMASLTSAASMCRRRNSTRC